MPAPVDIAEIVRLLEQHPTFNIPTPEEEIRLVGATGESAFGANYAAVGGSYQAPGYYKTSGGLVRLVGSVARTGAAVNGETIIAALPTGYRPAAIVSFLVPYDTTPNVSLVEIRTTGVVVWMGGAVTIAHLSLNGITFRAL